ncbi:Rieske 2Fe-2S domain-containing protein [Xanthomonas translucens]|uniref:Rieske 2Fe-2S domain-containing protein n=1 Tax=Xanthomonas campestris pv. translucens TaxID=343 RepID=UPI00071E8CA1|nr:Rieske 2Fe-2S domain-containing protein [Xanthomonas translucens]QEO25706.1 Rieske 2Fe-2S domain-containing protein [Xanthomonas translucens pv. undulosa]QSQ53316.1 Rieske 2Fe-2S domain-containing protein [Xanthomonas translucens pv. undulosa]QSQ61069.1 Rieske 2Fe-2S domain-containing protein [Xanthomonas translucens pv. undulosa]WLA01991.1 Rieske 2Fe-2S domain-containing protein [Xanthomonas translucens]
MLLDKHNAFVRRSVCGVDVVVQNVDGELRAFHNLCLHRQNPLQQQPQGVRPLVCGYHGWRYGAEGGIENIPFHDDAYRLPPQQRACLRLKRFAVACIGNLVFVNVSADPLPLEAQFSLPALDMLWRASEQFDSEVLVATFEANFNWKLAYENLRDALHPRFVHARTLARQVKFQVQMDDARIADAHRYHAQGSAAQAEHLARQRSFSNDGLNEPLQSLPHYAWHDKVERFGNDDWYMNWLLYPTLHIASGSGGYSFIIEHHQPLSAQRTDLTVYYVTARKKHRYATSDTVLLAHLQGAEMVGAGAIVGAHCDIAYNAWIRTAAVLEHGAKIGASAWIDAGVFIGAQAVIGSHATLGRRVDIAAGVRVGKRCTVDVPGCYRSDIAVGTHHLATLRTPVVIIDG